MNGASTEQRWRKQRQGTMEDDRGVKYKGFPPFCLWTKYIVGIWHFVYRFVMKPACYLTTALYLCIYLLHCKRRSICSLPLEKGTIEVCVCVLLFFEGEEECRVLVQPYSLTQRHTWVLNQFIFSFSVDSQLKVLWGGTIWYVPNHLLSVNYAKLLWYLENFWVSIMLVRRSEPVPLQDLTSLSILMSTQFGAKLQEVYFGVPRIVFTHTFASVFGLLTGQM